MMVFLIASTCMEAMDELLIFAKYAVPVATVCVVAQHFKQDRQRRVVFDSQIKQGTFDGNSSKEIMRRVLPLFSTAASCAFFMGSCTDNNKTNQMNNLGVAAVLSAVSVGATLHNYSHIKNAEHALIHRYDKREKDVESGSDS